MGETELHQPSPNFQVHRMETTDIVIPFRPLLSTIAQSIGFHEPEYHVLDAGQARVYVKIKSKRGNTHDLTYIGEGTNSIDESREIAAKTVVRDIMKKFKVIVEDYTYEHEREVERCCRLYRLRRIELEQIAKEATLTELEESASSSPQGYTHLLLDYMALLRQICSTITIKCSKLYSVEHQLGSYTAWMTIETPQSHPNEQILIGPTCITLHSAQQKLSKKAINYIIPAFNLRIMDVNYGSTESKATDVMLELERGCYLTTRAMMFGVQEEPIFSSLIEEEDCISIGGVLTYTPQPHLDLVVPEAEEIDGYPPMRGECSARRVLQFEGA